MILSAMVFAAGLGTRMRPYSDQLPKPAMPFYGRPLVAHTLAWLAEHGVGTVVVNLHHLADVMRSTVNTWTPHGLKVHFTEEPEILGTGGGLVAARHLFGANEPIVVVNGDIFTRIDLRVPLRIHRQHPGPVTLVLNDDPENEALFGVGVDLGKRVVDFWGDPPNAGAFRRSAFTGIHVVDPAFLDQLPSSGFACIKEQGWIPFLERGGEMRGAVVRGDWFDLGTPERYLTAHMSMLGAIGELAPPPCAVPAGVEIVPPVVIGPGLRAEGPARIGPAAFVGRGVTLAAGTHVRRSVVWDNAVVAGEVDRQIVAGPR